jgi:hypothetical protein
MAGRKDMQAMWRFAALTLDLSRRERERAAGPRRLAAPFSLSLSLSLSLPGGLG